MQTQQIYAASVIAASLCLTVASWMTPGDGAMWVAIPLRILSVLTAAAVVPLCLLWLSLARLATLDVPECASTILYSDDRFSHSDGHVSFYAPSGIWRGERIAYAHTKSRDIIPNGMYLYSVQPDGVSLAYATDSIFIPVPCE